MNVPLEIRVDATPNPNAVKLSTNRVLAAGRAESYSDPAAAFASPVARALFTVPGVAGVFLLRDFATVTRAPDAEWDELLPAVEQALRQALSNA